MVYAYLGPLGALREVPRPRPSVRAEVARGGSERFTLGGRRVVQRSARAARSWELSLLEWSSPEQVAYLAACASGAVAGPLFLHLGEAAQTNLLPAPLAAPGAMGLTSLGAVGVPVGVALPLVGLVQSSAAVQPAVVGAWSATIPVRPAVALTLSAWASAAGAAVAWRTVNAAGAQVATGTVTAAASAGGFRGSSAFTPSSTAVGVQVRLPAGVLRVGGLRLTEGPHASEWLPGHGVPQVVIDDPAQTLQLVMPGRVLSDYSVTIREVG